jgi:hypothetical protein
MDMPLALRLAKHLDALENGRSLRSAKLLTEYPADVILCAAHMLLVDTANQEAVASTLEVLHVFAATFFEIHGDEPARCTDDDRPMPGLYL